MAQRAVAEGMAFCGSLHKMLFIRSEKISTNPRNFWSSLQMRHWQKAKHDNSQKTQLTKQRKFQSRTLTAALDCVPVILLCCHSFCPK